MGRQDSTGLLLLLVLVMFLMAVFAPTAARHPHMVLGHQNGPRFMDVARKDFEKATVIFLQRIRSDYLVGAHEDLSFVVSAGNVSDRCRNDSLQYVFHAMDILKNRLTPSGQSVPEWVYRMLDSSAKLPSGIMEGNLRWLGSFSECLKIRVNGSDGQESFRGQYCALTFQQNATSPMEMRSKSKGTLGTSTQTKGPTVSEVTMQDTKFSIQDYFSIGICWPSTCQDSEVKMIVQRLLNYSFIPSLKNSSRAEVNSVTCQSEARTQLDNSTIVIIFLFSLFGLLMLVGTLLEFIAVHVGLDGFTVAVDSESQRSSRHSFFAELLMCFSVYNNGQKLLNTSQQGQNMTCIYGIRFISMLWIVLGHTFDFAVNLPLKDSIDVMSILENWSFCAVLMATFAVDTFLLLSGFLATFSLLKALSGEGKLNFICAFLHRYWRLTPALGMLVALIAGPFYLMGSGPQWPDVFRLQSNCRTSWWKNILYINNLFDATPMCADISWYLSLDVQFFIIAIPIVILLNRNYKVGCGMILVCFLITIATPFGYIYANDIPGYVNKEVLFHPTDPAVNQFNSMVYIKPYCRMSPYLIGMVLAFFLYKRNMNVEIHKMVAWFGWPLAIGLGLYLIYGNFRYYATDEVMSAFHNALYGSLASTGWGVVVAFVMLMCLAERGGIINHFLSWKFFMPLSRLTYAAYLLHIYVLILLFETQEMVYFIDTYLFTIMYIGSLVITLMVSAVWFLAFESPMVKLENLVKSLCQRESCSWSFECCDHLPCYRRYRGRQRIETSVSVEDDDAEVETGKAEKLPQPEVQQDEKSVPYTVSTEDCLIVEQGKLQQSTGDDGKRPSTSADGIKPSTPGSDGELPSSKSSSEHPTLADDGEQPPFESGSEPPLVGDGERPSSVASSGERPSSATGSEPPLAGDSERPSSMASSGERPSATGSEQPPLASDSERPSANGGEVPSLVSDSEQPSSSGDSENPVHTDDGARPPSVSDGEHPTLPDNGECPASAGEGEQQSSAEHNEVRSETSTADLQSGLESSSTDPDLNGHKS